MLFTFRFKKKEILVLIAIVGILLLATYANLVTALRRRRDAQRRADLGAIADALFRYQEDFGFFPSSSSKGEIMACQPGVDSLEVVKNEEGQPIFGPCRWGWDGLKDIYDPSFPPYLPRLPTDPKHSDGVRYFYISTGSHYQLYAALEGSEEGYEEGILKRGLACGTRICNFGVTHGQTPLDKSLEEYENELRRKLEIEN